jgi:hypothetical protein
MSITVRKACIFVLIQRTTIQQRTTTLMPKRVNLSLEHYTPKKCRRQCTLCSDDNCKNASESTLAMYQDIVESIYLSELQMKSDPFGFHYFVSYCFQYRNEMSPEEMIEAIRQEFQRHSHMRLLHRQYLKKKRRTSLPSNLPTITNRPSTAPLSSSRSYGLEHYIEQWNKYEPIIQRVYKKVLKRDCKDIEISFCIEYFIIGQNRIEESGEKCEKSISFYLRSKSREYVELKKQHKLTRENERMKKNDKTRNELQERRTGVFDLFHIFFTPKNVDFTIHP